MHTEEACSWGLAMFVIREPSSGTSGQVLHYKLQQAIRHFGVHFPGNVHDVK